jgi:hypothetical protein
MRIPGTLSLWWIFEFETPWIEGFIFYGFMEFALGSDGNHACHQNSVALLAIFTGTLQAGFPSGTGDTALHTPKSAVKTRQLGRSFHKWQATHPTWLQFVHSEALHTSGPCRNFEPTLPYSSNSTLLVVDLLRSASYLGGIGGFSLQNGQRIWMCCRL